MQAASALPVGFSSQAEILDIWLDSPIDLRTARDDLGQTLPKGISVLSLEKADSAEPPLSTRVQASKYSAVVETSESLAAVQSRVDEILASESLPRQRRKRSYDLRPLILRLKAKDGPGATVELEMVLSAREGATGRPEEVLDELGLADGFYAIRRERLVFGEMV
jgi:radical SAM-linked protein